MKVSKVSENIIKDFKNERFDEIRRNIGDDITNDGIFPDLQAEMKKKIEELVGNPSAKKYGLKSRAKFELAEKNSTLEAIAQSRTVDNTALYEQMRAEISARVRAQLGLPPKEAEKPAQEKVPNPEKDTIKRAMAGCDPKAVTIDASDGIAHLVRELTVEEPRRTPVRGRKRTPLMDPGRTPEGHLQPVGPDHAEDGRVPQNHGCPQQESTTGGRTREWDSRHTTEGHLEPLGPEDERTSTHRRYLEKDARHTPEGDLQPLGPDYAECENRRVPQKYCSPEQGSTTGGITREGDSRHTPEGHLEPLGPENGRPTLGRTLERDSRHTPEGHLQPLGPDYGSTPKRNPAADRKYNRNDRRRALYNRRKSLL